MPDNKNKDKHNHDDKTITRKDNETKNVKLSSNDVSGREK